MRVNLVREGKSLRKSFKVTVKLLLFQLSSFLHFVVHGLTLGLVFLLK